MLEKDVPHMWYDLSNRFFSTIQKKKIIVNLLHVNLFHHNIKLLAPVIICIYNSVNKSVFRVTLWPQQSWQCIILMRIARSTLPRLSGSKVTRISRWKYRWEGWHSDSDISKTQKEIKCYNATKCSKNHAIAWARFD